MRITVVVLVAVLVTAGVVSGQQGSVVVGAKNFTESGVLAEIIAQTLEEHTELEVQRRINLGGTMICWGALEAGEIDLYAEYTGTGWANILKETGAVRGPLHTYFHVRRQSLERFGVRWMEPFGFNNTYAMSMDEGRAEALGIRSISDLVEHQADLRGGFSIEFGSRADGYPGLTKVYGLELGTVRALEHGLAYQAIQAGDIDLIDAYITDGKLLRYRLRVLEDDRGCFPPYHAAPVVRQATLDAHPEIEPALAKLGFSMTDSLAQALNYVVENEGQSLTVVARAFLEREGIVDGVDANSAKARELLDDVMLRTPDPGDPSSEGAAASRWAQVSERLPTLLLQHLGLTLVAVLLATLVAIPLGIWITSRPRWRQVVLGAAGVVQTIPSLALLAFMIPLLGLDLKAAIAALFLYALLPIVRNTYTGIAEVDPDLVDAARGMGLRPREILTRVQLPLAMRTIMAGIRTSTVISVGVATLAAFIGAGGLGEPIVEGLYLNDVVLILSGAIPAALLALFVDFGLGRVEHALQPRMTAA